MDTTFFNTIENDQRLPLIWKLLTSFMIDTDIKESMMVTKGDILFVVTRNSIVYEVNLDTIPGPDIYFLLDTSTKDGTQYIKINNIFKCEELDNYFNEYHNNLSNYKVISRETDLVNNEDFENFKNIKASMGVRFYKSKDPYVSFMFPIFTGFPKLAKNDNLSYTIYETFKSDNTLLLDMELFKKKINRVVHIRYRMLNIGAKYNKGE